MHPESVPLLPFTLASTVTLPARLLRLPSTVALAGAGLPFGSPGIAACGSFVSGESLRGSGVLATEAFREHLAFTLSSVVLLLI